MKIGDIVYLKSGGPPMTVQDIQGDQFHCAWVHEGHAMRAPFSAAMLTTEPRAQAGETFREHGDWDELVREKGA